MNETCATLPTRLARSSGWRRWGWAALFGAVATLALPPVCGVPLLLIAVPGLLWLLDGVGEPRSAFALGWWFGFAYFGFGLYWISFALLTDIAQFWWLMPVAIAGLPALMAIFTGLVTMTVWSLGGRGLVRVVTFATVWVIAEWLRGHLFTGFPWQLVGYCWVDYSEVLQTAAVTGVYGLSLLTMLVAGLPALLADPSVPRRRALMALACGLTLFASLAVAGTWRLASAEVETVAGVRLRLVQANIDQGRKWADSEREGNFQRHLEMSVAPSALGKGWQPTVVIWPETAIAYFLAQDVRHRAAVAAAVPPGGLILTGAPRATLEPKVAPRATLEPKVAPRATLEPKVAPRATLEPKVAPRATLEPKVAPRATLEPAPVPEHSVRFWNSMIAEDGAGRIIASYDKFHLVPFGEYIPGRELLPSWLPIGAIAARGSDFSPGPGPRTLHLPGLPPVSPLICYEAIFPRAVIDDGDRPAWLLNLTNDAWYGRTAGPHQHFAIAQTRAVEEGLPLVRVANTGISGVVDSYGRITAWLSLGKAGIIDTALPPALPQPTLYARFGDSILGLMLLICCLFLVIAPRIITSDAASKDNPPPAFPSAG